MTDRPIFEQSVDTRLALGLLKQCEPGATVTYEALEQHLGRPLPSIRSAINSARRAALADDGMVFETVRRVGLLRIEGARVIDAAQSNIETARRAAGRGLRKLSTVDRDKLKPAERIGLDTKATVLALMKAAGKDASQRKIEKAVTTTAQQLPLGKTLEALK